jgi:hypothetical protein
MKKPPKDKMMREADATTKAPTALICLSECVVNGFGTIAKDAEVTDPALIAYLTEHGDHPNFKSKED